jgi:hypothetical protein
MANWSVGVAAGAAGWVTAVVAVPTSGVAVTVVAAVDGIALTETEGGTVGILGDACATSVTVVACAAACPVVSGEADGVDVFVSVESVAAGLAVPVPETVVVVTLRSVLVGSVEPVVVVSDEADGVDVLVCAESVEVGLVVPVPETVVVVTLRSVLVGSVEPVVVVSGEADGVDVLVCAESVEVGLSVPAPEAVALVTLRSELTMASPAEPVEFAWLAPEVESDSESAVATAPLMALIRSTAVIKHAAASPRLRLTIMSVSPQRSFGVSCW